MNDKQIAWIVAEFLGVPVIVDIDTNLQVRVGYVDVRERLEANKSIFFNPYDSDIVLRCHNKLINEGHYDKLQLEIYREIFEQLPKEHDVVENATINCVVAICDCDIPEELG